MTMANDDSDGIVSRRPPLERQAGDRNLQFTNLETRQLSLPAISSSESASGVSGGGGDVGAAAYSIRNKIKYEESVQRMQEIQCHLEQTSQHTPSTCEMLRLMSSSLQETNIQNENTIKHLQSQLIEVTRERDAARKDAERSKEITAKHRTEWEDKFHQERRGFAKVIRNHKKEALELKRKVNKLGRQRRQMKCEFEERQGVVKLGEERSPKETADSTTSDANVPHTVLIHYGTQVEERSNDGSGQQYTATTATSSNTDSAHKVFRERIAQFAHSVDVKLQDWKRMRSLEIRQVAAVAPPSSENGLVEKNDKNTEQSRIETKHEFSSDVGEKQKPGAENYALDSSMEEFVQLASDMNEKMKRFAHHHEAIVRDYEEKLTMVNGELNQVSTSLSSLKEQYEVLGAVLKESNEAEGCCEQVFVDAIAEKDEALQKLNQQMKKVTLDRDGAYDACDVLQVEIDLLRQMLKSSSLKESPQARKKE